jgi:hypothetical protein
MVNGYWLLVDAGRSSRGLKNLPKPGKYSIEWAWQLLSSLAML